MSANMAFVITDAA